MEAGVFEMSRKPGKSIFASTGLAILAVSVASLALASIPSNLNGKDARRSFTAPKSGLPSAVGGVALFDDGYGPVCYDKDDVLSYFDRDRVQIGGEMVTLETGFDQDFADAWRSETELQPVTISGVFAHIFANDSGFEHGRRGRDRRRWLRHQPHPPHRGRVERDPGSRRRRRGLSPVGIPGQPSLTSIQSR